MISVNRIDLYDAIGFLKGSIESNEDSGPASFLHVRPTNSSVILTAKNSFSSKRKELERPILADEGEELESPFLISRATLISFETLLEKHKEKAKTLAKNDSTYLFVQISDTKLESMGVDIVYSQPSVNFLNIDDDFFIESKPASRFFLRTSRLKKFMSGFDGSAGVEVILAEDSEGIPSALFSQPSTGCEALFILDDKSILDEQTKDDDNEPLTMDEFSEEDQPEPENSEKEPDLENIEEDDEVSF